MAAGMGSFEDLITLLERLKGSTEYTTLRSWKPRRCANSGKSLWLKTAVRQRKTHASLLLSPSYVDQWYTPAEALIEQLKS
jgi:hypothetical protein